MAEKEDVFSSKVKYNGIFPFSDFYKFCYDWLLDEAGMPMAEEKYAEKISGESKDIDFEWKGSKKVDDYFKYELKVKFKIIGLTKVEIKDAEGKTLKSNKGSIEIGIKGTLVRDYEGKFDTSPMYKFMRRVYDKWILVSRVKEVEGKLVDTCNDFLEQAKAYLDLAGRK
jgi:hypothetical protein